VLFSLLREDKVLANADCTQFTIKAAEEGYSTYTDIFKAKFPGYKLDSRQSLVTDPDQEKNINLEKHLTFLKSKDTEDQQSYDWMFDDKYRFLDNEACLEKIALTSMPGAGNAQLR